MLKILQFANNSEQLIVKHLKSTAAQSRINDCLELSQLGSLHRLFEELGDNSFHADISPLIIKINEKNEWENFTFYLKDLAVIAYQEFFDLDTGQLKKVILDAINHKNPTTFEKLKTVLGEEELYKGILVAYLQKMILNSCQSILLAKVLQTAQNQMKVAKINERLQQFMDSLRLEECHQLVLKCLQVKSEIICEFDLLKPANKDLETKLAKLKDLIHNKRRYILVNEVIEYEKIISQIEKSYPSLPISKFSKVVHDGFKSLAKEKFSGYRAASENFDSLILTHDFREELNKLQMFVKNEIAQLLQVIEHYSYENDQKEIKELIFTLAQHVGVLRGDLALIEKVSEERKIFPNDLVKLKLQVMGDIIALRQNEIEIEKHDLELNKNMEVKAKTLDDFQLFLQSQRDKIWLKLETPNSLVREDISEIVKEISEKKNQIYATVSAHQSSVFAFFSRHGFHVPTNSEKLLDKISRSLDAAQAESRELKTKP